MDTSQLLIGDLILIRGDEHKFVDDAILLGELIERGAGVYVHVAVYIGDGQIAEAQSGELSGIYSLSKYSEYDVGRVDLDDASRGLIVESAHYYSGRPYGWPSIFLIILDILFRIVLSYRERNFICTQLVNRIFQRACNITFSNKIRPMPDDVAFDPKVVIL